MITVLNGRVMFLGYELVKKHDVIVFFPLGGRVSARSDHSTA
jgi:hypothetical protein